MLRMIFGFIIDSCTWRHLARRRSHSDLSCENFHATIIGYSRFSSDIVSEVLQVYIGVCIKRCRFTNQHESQKKHEAYHVVGRCTECSGSFLPGIIVLTLWD